MSLRTILEHFGLFTMQAFSLLGHAYEGTEPPWLRESTPSTEPTSYPELYPKLITRRIILEDQQGRRITIEEETLY